MYIYSFIEVTKMKIVLLVLVFICTSVQSISCSYKISYINPCYPANKHDKFQKKWKSLKDNGKYTENFMYIVPSEQVQNLKLNLLNNVIVCYVTREYSFVYSNTVLINGGNHIRIPIHYLYKNRTPKKNVSCDNEEDYNFSAYKVSSMRSDEVVKRLSEYYIFFVSKKNDHRISELEYIDKVETILDIKNGYDYMIKKIINWKDVFSYCYLTPCILLKEYKHDSSKMQ